MQFAANTNIYFNRPDGTKGDVVKCINYCGEAGFKKMDISFLDYVNFGFPIVTDRYMEWIDTIIETAAKYDIVFDQGHAPFYNFCDRNAKNKEFQDLMVLRSIECAEKMGVKWLAIHAGTDYESAWMRKSSKEKNREYFLPILEYASKHNVGIAFENLWDYNIAPKKRYTAIAEDLKDLVDSFDCEYAGICFDTDHAVLSGLDPAKELDVIADKLKSTHISDCIDIAADHLLPFDGITDWKPFMKKLKQIGYDGDLGFEIHRYTQYMPDALVPSAIKRAVEVGNYLLTLTEE